MPPPNNLLPKNLDLLPEELTLSQRPTLIQQWEETDLWYLKDDKFKRPKAIANVKLYTNDCMFGRSAQGRVFIEVWNAVVKEYLREFYYMASMAELEAYMSAYNDNLNI